MEVVISIIVVVLGGLVIWLWPSKVSEEPTFVTVFTTGDPALIALIKSLLKESQIPYSLKGEGVQDLFGIGRLGAGYNIITGPVQIQVPTQWAQEARELLSDLKEVT